MPELPEGGNLNPKDISVQTIDTKGPQGKNRIIGSEGVIKESTQPRASRQELKQMLAQGLEKQKHLVTPQPKDVSPALSHRKIGMLQEVSKALGSDRSKDSMGEMTKWIADMNLSEDTSKDSVIAKKLAEMYRAKLHETSREGAFVNGNPDAKVNPGELKVINPQGEVIRTVQIPSEPKQGKEANTVPSEPAKPGETNVFRSLHPIFKGKSLPGTIVDVTRRADGKITGVTLLSEKYNTRVHVKTSELLQQLPNGEWGPPDMNDLLAESPQLEKSGLKAA